MHRYIIEREMPAIGAAEPDVLRAAAQKSNETLAGLGPQIQWLESYVTDDKIYCVYLSEDAGLIRRHADACGIPATSIAEVRRTIDPTTADA